MNFLTVHPRTALWWKQREDCRRCVHQSQTPLVRSKTNSVRGGGMTCSAVKAHKTSCLCARDEGMPCGPEGKLYAPV